MKLCLKNNQVIESRQFHNSSCPHARKTDGEDIYLNLTSNEITLITPKERKNLMVKNMRQQSCLLKQQMSDKVTNFITLIANQ